MFPQDLARLCEVLLLSRRCSRPHFQTALLCLAIQFGDTLKFSPLAYCPSDSGGFVPAMWIKICDLQSC